jgi:hypothetical protein
VIGEPPLASALSVQGLIAIWTKPWGNFFTEVWQSIAYGWFWQTKTVTSNYTVEVTDSVILINGDITVTLPAIKKVGPKKITVKVINAGGGTRTVDGGGVNIDGASSVTSTTQYDAWDFVNDGSNYFIV